MLRPVDALLLLKLAAQGPSLPTVRAIADELGISKSAMATSMRRLQEAELLIGKGRERRLNVLAIHEFLEHAVRYLLPARFGPWQRGLPTAHSAEPLASRLLGDIEPVVIPLRTGPSRGRALSPIHRLAPRAAARDRRLYRLLVIVDALRIGRARERALAAKELRSCLQEAQST